MRTLQTLIFFLIASFSFSQEHPFPQHIQYENHIKPSQYSQTGLDRQVGQFYNTWKSRYLKSACESGQYYVDFDSESAINVSEGLGYGMMITALMAGYDPDAQKYFDGLYYFFRAHPSGSSPDLMAWRQVAGCQSDSDGAATDGDVDIAYALLLAHAQWGSRGKVSYLNEARKVIAAIMRYEVNRRSWTMTLGDWVKSSDAYYYNSTRTSDFITDHFRAFACASENSDWNKIVDKCYAIIAELQSQSSPESGLLPDFVVAVNETPQPAGADFLEGDNDGHYYYNACRDPWRLMSDYLLSGDDRPLQAVKKINTWLREKYNGDPTKVESGFLLDGTTIGSYQDASFLGPFTVGAMSDPEQQEWLNGLYDQLLGLGTSSGYYGNTIKLMSMLVISGNYWSPDCVSLTEKITGVGAIEPKFRTIVQPETLWWIFEEGNFNKVLRIEIIDLSGRVLIQKEVCSASVAIDLNSLPKGSFISRVYFKDHSAFASIKFLQ